MIAYVSQQKAYVSVWTGFMGSMFVPECTSASVGIQEGRLALAPC